MRLTVYFPEDSPTTHEFVGKKLTVGRLADNDVHLDEGSVSSHHAEIVVRDDQAVLVDLASTNGTFLRGEQVTGENPIFEGDEIYFGGVRSVFMEPVAVPLPVAELPAFSASEDAGTGCPENFRYMSPLPRAQKPKDALAMAAWASIGIGLLALAYTVSAIFSA
ncbi:MAG: FHA domain-containing protein [Chthoniobacterales bacterium]|jgi:pSer/pThr/pTyr-binding forkhead associated (FHA) protein